MQEVFEKIKKKIRIVSKEACGYAPLTRVISETALKDIIDEVAAENNNGWIPFTKRKITEEEKKTFGEELVYMLDCPLPDEDEEILITYKFKDEFYVDVDTFMREGSECYLDSGRDLVTEAVAWRKLPTPYQPKGE